jgi:hypothetical protein
LERLAADTDEKVFCEERKFIGPLMHFVRGDVRDRVASQNNDHGPSYWRYAVSRGRVVQKSTFARFLASFDFRLFQHYPPGAAVPTDRSSEREPANGFIETMLGAASQNANGQISNQRFG